MDITDFRSLATVLCFVAFSAVVWWAYAPGRRQQFEDAARLPFADEPDVTERTPPEGERT